MQGDASHTNNSQQPSVQKVAIQIGRLFPNTSQDAYFISAVQTAG